MLEGLFQRLADAIFGQKEFEEGLDVNVNLSTDPLDSMVRFLRQIPGDDMSKKRELGNFFKTLEGEDYSSEERKAAYDELLGVQRNRETIG